MTGDVKLTEACGRCCGNGEIVLDWDSYLHPRPGDVGDEAVAECPDCDGEGITPAGRHALGKTETTP